MDIKSYREAYLISPTVLLMNQLHVPIEVLVCPKRLAALIFLTSEWLIFFIQMGAHVRHEVSISKIACIAPFVCAFERSFSGVRAHVLCEADWLCIRF